MVFLELLSALGLVLGSVMGLEAAEAALGDEDPLLEGPVPVPELTGLVA